MRGYGINSEYGRLTRILIHLPGPEIADHPDPLSIQQIAPINHGLMSQEYRAFQETFARLGITVQTMDPDPAGDGQDHLYNLMFCRDLFFMTPAGAILASMANENRRPETACAARALERLGVPIIHRVHGEGRFEGADGLWLNENNVIIGVGNRTNSTAFNQIKEVLEKQGVNAIPLPSTQTRTQHLLGSLQIVDRNLSLVRQELIDPSISGVLESHGFRVVPLPENDEIRQRQAMNILAVAPRTIVMTAGCPATRRIYELAGLSIAAELEISQLINGAGGLACATGVIARSGSHEKYELT